jgi:hypothetical protein
VNRRGFIFDWAVERLRGKLGAKAYVNRVVVIDYPNGLLRLQQHAVKNPTRWT